MSNLPEKYTVSFSKEEPYCQEALDKINEMFHTKTSLDRVAGCHVKGEEVFFYSLYVPFHENTIMFTAKEFYQLTNS